MEPDNDIYLMDFTEEKPPSRRRNYASGQNEDPSMLTGLATGFSAGCMTVIVFILFLMFIGMILPK